MFARGDGGLWRSKLGSTCRKQFWGAQILVSEATNHNNIQSNKMLPNFSEMNSLYFPNQFYSNTPYILYFLPQTTNFGSLESLEVPKLLTPIQIENGRCLFQQKTKLKKTHKISKPAKLQERKSSSENSRMFKSQVSLKTNTSLPSHQAKKPLQERENEVNLDFRIQWKNQYRNIVPNLINQTLSFLTKKCKSQTYISMLFDKHPHPDTWHLPKFYQYMKRIKDQISHYVDEKVINYFFRIQQTSGNIYQEGEQEFYMKISRIAVMHYMRSEAIPVSLTSPRMKDSKRAIHLIARRAILQKFREMALEKFK